MTDPNAPLTALVEYQVRTDETTTADWLDVWKKRAQDALEAEPHTTTYAAAASLEDESSLFFYEHYENGRAGLKFHMERPSHVVLNETMGRRRMTKRRVMGTGFFDLPDFGWRGRGGNTLISSSAIFSLSGLRFGNDAQKSDAIRLLRDHADYCFVEEPETLIYSGGIATQDADRGPAIKQGDLIFIMACTDMAAVEKHRQDPRHLALGQRIIDAGVEVTSTFRKMYRTTGHGFLVKAV
ncbi:antibiotic biosynthesis monooxygenase [Pseudomonadales bacterium]|nr:antibiotic biosynthesis monooxygenase [Pseudomonadales bacterium]MDC1230297.1 antibiotic biosynthesis monooxygenase [bacterium]MDC1329191.1 antibiotic biosynthesis monooxygenase [Pseudomonadales bacterium]